MSDFLEQDRESRKDILRLVGGKGAGGAGPRF